MGVQALCMGYELEKSVLCTARFDKLSRVVSRVLLHILPGQPSRVVPNYSLAILANIVHACHVGSHVDFSFIQNVMNCSPKLSSRKPKAGPCDILNQ